MEAGSVSFPFRSILVPVDFDDNSKSALDLAQELSAIVDGSLHVLHVIAILLAPGESASFVATREEEVRAALEKMASAQLGRVKFQIHIRVGDTARGIVDTARELHNDLIVMPTHGRRGLPRFFLGSVAERVMREAPCPVLSFRPAPSEAEKPDSVGKVMIKNPPSVSPTNTLAEAHGRMQREELLSIPVALNGVLVGIVTDRDIRSHLGQLESTKVETAMTLGPVTVSPTLPIDEAARLLVKLGVGALPVVENGKLQGLLSHREIIQTLLDRSEKD
jgi:nucleotide-binding universal stress UspA family protein/CBS domain-containing protein